MSWNLVLPFTADDDVGSVCIAPSALSACRARLSSITVRTLFNLDPDFRGWCPEDEGCGCLRLMLDPGGDTDLGGVGEPGGGVEEGDGTSAHSDVESAGKCSPLLGSHGVLPKVDLLGVVDSGGVVFIGVGDGECAVALIERGCRMLNIWSSACGGPYESNGSGMD